MTEVPLLQKPISFDWDDGNDTKNWIKHSVTKKECEQIFFNKIKIFEDVTHSTEEKRFTAYGKTDNNRKLTIIFTFRKLLIRVISARDQNKKEKIKYETK